MATVDRLLYRIACAYYESNLTQAEIADRFGVSRIKVSRLLTKAREEGVVRISVVPPPMNNAELEQELESAYGLDEAIVVNADAPDYVGIVAAIGRAAAEYVLRVIEDGKTLGLTWGNSILAAVNSLPMRSLQNVRAVQLLGGLGELEAEIHGAELIRRTAERLGCKPRIMHAPGIVATPSVRDALVADPQVADTLELGRHADVALLGIGALGPHSVLRGEGTVLTDADCRTLAELGIVGDIALRFFDSEGTPVDTPFTHRTIGINLEELGGIEKRVGVAGGKEKHAALAAALRGNHINVVVTDSGSAAALLRAVPGEDTTGGGE